MSCKCETSGCCSAPDILKKILSNTYVLLLKTQNVHWNLTGPRFRSIHLLTEDHYNNLFEAVDEIAEKIRMLGEKAPATFDEYAEKSCIDCKLSATSEADMIKELIADNETILEGLKKAMTCLSDSDAFTVADLLTSRMSHHEKAIWMLKSSLN